MAVTIDESASTAGQEAHSDSGASEVFDVGETFEEFYRREFHSVAGLAYALCGSTGAAEDITQEAFLAAFRQWQSLKNPGSWIRRIVANKSVSQFRRRASETKALFRLRESALSGVDIPGHDEALWSEVRKLPKRQTQVLALRYISGNTISDIADLLDISENTVKTHLKRGKHTLNDRLKETR